ncbi:hypothetical protein KEM09_11990 [Carboxylicivirga mesophila]|uniref:DUF1574 domain-containing protein n=1 Tax=Carboxylicivirga mesophila TaxID=1166478 RepID=A0ABS5KAT5_9BACT|nr:hypothetical protein [Carboxylicivirga mesophila]MBS2212130.1 hypothetical protein [Carboxylicivirga mesophila]
MIQLLKKLFYFACFLPAFYLAGLMFFGDYAPNIKTNLSNYGYTAKRLSEADTISKVDIIFVGSSHTYRGFDTRLFEIAGYKTFNLGTSNQTHIQTQMLLKQYIRKLNPKLVVYEVYPGTLQNDGVESSLDLIAHRKTSFEMFKMVTQVNHLLTYNSFFYKLLMPSEAKKDNDINISNDSTDHYINGGFVERENTNNTIFNNQPYSFTISKKQLKAFKLNLLFLKQQEIPFLLVMAPVTKTKFNNITNRLEIDSLYTGLGDYINYNYSILGLNDTIDFYDAHHLNQSGVIKFNQQLLKDLNEFSFE